MTGEVKQERKVKIKIEWITPNDYARTENYVKQVMMMMKNVKMKTDMTSYVMMIQTTKKRKSVIVM